MPDFQGKLLALIPTEGCTDDELAELYYQKAGKDVGARAVRGTFRNMDPRYGLIS